jgi:hypothetical protein
MISSLWFARIECGSPLLQKRRYECVKPQAFAFRRRETFVLSPELYYAGNKSEVHTGINFITSSDKYGRITFENLDAIKICRGEVMPYEFDWSLCEDHTWVFQIENSKWLPERFDYENEHYGKAYEFGGNVHDMQTDFEHYLFSFHDEFIEAIARGFWFEEDENSLLQKGLSSGPLSAVAGREYAEV